MRRESLLGAARRALGAPAASDGVEASSVPRFPVDVLERIPEQLRDSFAEIYVIDDSSLDDTYGAAFASGRRLGFTNLQGHVP